MLIDTHSHLNFIAYDKDRDEVIKRTLAGDVWMLNVGSNYETSKQAVEIAQNHKQGVYAAVGLHPINLDTGLVKIKTDEAEGEHFEKDFDYEKYKVLAGSPKVVAIGEIGLDYWYKPKTKTKFEIFKQKQKEVFLRQLELTRELGLPVIFHCRLAHDDLIHDLTNYAYVQKVKLRGVVHCFTGNWREAEQYLSLGLYLGFNGIIFKLDLNEVIKKTPLERVLVETDCPYLTPAPREGRNEPLYVKDIAQRIAEIRGESSGEVIQATTEGARTLFNLD